MANFKKPPTLTNCGSRKLLRRLELEAYASVVSAYRAQGHLNREKKSSLEQLSKCLGISPERHRAELRRAVNDDVLSQVADSISGVDTDKAWRREGKKLLSGLPPRLVSHSHPSVLPQALTAITAATHTISPSLGTGSSSLGEGGFEASRKVPTPIQNALRVILSNVPLKTEQQTPTSGASKAPKLPSTGVQRGQIGVLGVVKEEPEVTGSRSSPSRNVLGDPGKIYSQLESLLCEEQLRLPKGGSEDGDEGNKMTTSADEKKEREVSNGSPLRSLRARTGQDSNVRSVETETGSDKVGASQDGGASEGESADALSDAGKTISDLISRISRKRQPSPVQSNDLPAAKKKALPANEGAVSVRARVTKSPLVCRSSIVTTSKIASVSTGNTSKASIQASVKTSPATSRAISILRAVATNKAAATSSKGTSTGTAKLPFGSKVPSPAKSQANSAGVQVIPISSQTDPALNQAIETLNKALSSLNKAGISSLSAVSPSVKASAAAALISKKGSPLRSLSPSRRPSPGAQATVVANPRTSVPSKDETQRLPQSSQNHQKSPASQNRIAPRHPQESLQSVSRRLLEQLPPTRVQLLEPLPSKPQQPQKPLPHTTKQPEPLSSTTKPPELLPQQSPKPLPQQSQEPLPQVSQELQEQPLPHGTQEARDPAASLDLATTQQSQLASSRSQQEMLSVATRLLQEAFSVLPQATMSKAAESIFTLSQSGQQLLPSVSQAPVATESRQQATPQGLVPSQEAVSSQQIQEQVLFQPSQEAVLPRISQKPVPSQAQELPQLQTTAAPQQAVLGTSAQSQHRGPAVQMPVGNVIKSFHSSEPAAQQQVMVASQPPLVSVSLPPPDSVLVPTPSVSVRCYPLPTASSQPCSTTPPPLIVFSQQHPILVQTVATTSLTSASNIVTSLLAEVPPVESPVGQSVVNQAQPLPMYSEPYSLSKTHKEQQQQQLIVPSLTQSQSIPPDLIEVQATLNEQQLSEGRKHPPTLIELHQPVQSLLKPQDAGQPGSSMVDGADVHPNQGKPAADVVHVEVEASSDSLNISDLIQDTSDSMVSSLASQLAGLENVIPLLNMDFMALLQPTTPDSPADALPMFPPPDLPLKIDSALTGPSSGDVSSSHLHSPIVPDPLMMGPSPFPPNLDGTLPNNTTASADSSEPLVEISTLATSKDVANCSGSAVQGNTVASSPAEYLDLDINSLMDPSNLLEGIPEDMAKSIQTIVQLDEETWK